MGDFFAFRTMIAAGFIQVIFVIGLAGIVLASLGAIANDQAITGLILLAFGTLYWRVLCEVFIVFFRMNDTLSAIKQDTASIPSSSSGPSAPPDAAPAIEPA
jgi:Domain of unknown function (DUF4282)